MAQGGSIAPHVPCTAAGGISAPTLRGMGLDLVEMMMGHEGYLTKSYRRIPQDEARKQFHEGELVLFITVASKRTEERIVEGVKQEMTKQISAQDRMIEKMQLRNGNPHADR